ncbi:TPA: hypothetical protein U0G25_002769 [Listeria monocytogenes]|uniref:hypothetical protein n=1 Tax=Listeria seeligeri TaxID=1640 RepID=UPI001626B637|nr:hypothetical protein [Listeria seeligeri]EGQ5594061.1 hypothetical protein [Listeria monocytogenes]MBC2232264.1 hypothetical protein [Listeria seeligeri]MBC6130537.1 hypothetical protein [Listeria seeligeri]MBF2626237.1 hypothetical protein [Listeria seeligeri]HAM1373430.1 hypothetical protein [Listeria monocytogenes]
MNQIARELVELIMENPDLPVVTLTETPGDINQNLDVAGIVFKPYIDYIYKPTSDDLLGSQVDDRPYFKSIDECTALQELSERVAYLNNTFMKEVEDETKRIWDNYAWRKVILIYSGHLDEIADLDREREVFLKEEAE